MGEYADMFLDGLLDEETGELIDGDAPGYPRSPHRERRQANRRNARKAKQAKPFLCRTCGKRLKSQQSLDDHCRDKHGINSEQGESDGWR